MHLITVKNNDELAIYLLKKELMLNLCSIKVGVIFMMSQKYHINIINSIIFNTFRYFLYYLRSVIHYMFIILNRVFNFL